MYGPLIAGGSLHIPEGISEHSGEEGSNTAEHQTVQDDEEIKKEESSESHFVPGIWRPHNLKCSESGSKVRMEFPKSWFSTGLADATEDRDSQIFREYFSAYHDNVFRAQEGGRLRGLLNVPFEKMYRKSLPFFCESISADIFDDYAKISVKIGAHLLPEANHMTYGGSIFIRVILASAAKDQEMAIKVEKQLVDNMTGSLINDVRAKSIVSIKREICLIYMKIILDHAVGGRPQLG